METVIHLYIEGKRVVQNAKSYNTHRPYRMQFAKRKAARNVPNELVKWLIEQGFVELDKNEFTKDRKS